MAIVILNRDYATTQFRVKGQTHTHGYEPLDGHCPLTLDLHTTIHMEICWVSDVFSC